MGGGGALNTDVEWCFKKYMPCKISAKISVSHSRFFRLLGVSISFAKLRKFQTHRKTTCIAISPKFSNLPLAIPTITLTQNTHKYLVSLRNGVPMCFTGGGTGNVLVVMSSIEEKDYNLQIKTQCRKFNPARLYSVLSVPAIA